MFLPACGRLLSSRRCALALGLAVLLLPVGAASQEQDTRSPEIPRTDWGDPDLRGIWTNTTSTPFERPEEFGEREFLTDEEYAEERAEAERKARAAVEGEQAPAASGPEHWYEHHGKTSNRTSHVVDPPNGQVPPLTDQARQRPKIGTVHREQFDSWTDLSAWDRCITRGIPGSMLPTFYNNNYQIMQTQDHLVIFYEMIHDVRFIPLDGRPRLPGGIRQWMGDSRGRWEGDTLVIEVTNFTDQTPLHPVRGEASSVNHGKDLRVTERFRRVDADTIEYGFTIEDASTFTRQWSAVIPMTRSGAPDAMLEYACHEGNHAVPHILSGSRSHDASEN